MDETSRTFLIKGDDTALVAEARDRILDELVSDDARATSIEELDVTEVSVDVVVDACQTPSLFGDLRVVVVRNVGALKTAEVDDLVGFIAEPLDTSALICIAGGGQIPKRLADAIRKHGNVIDTAVPTGRARSSWFQTQLSELPVKFSPPARESLFEHLGEDVSRMFGIADALASAYGSGATISPEQLDPFLGEAGAVAPWELTDAIDRGDIASALSQLHRMMGAGERHGLVILSILNRHFRAMLAVDGDMPADEHAAAARLGMAPYPAKKAMAQAQRIGHGAIVEAIGLLANADDAVRGGSGLSDEAVMEVLVARLSRLSKGGVKPSRPATRAGIRSARAALR